MSVIEASPVKRERRKWQFRIKEPVMVVAEYHKGACGQIQSRYVSERYGESYKVVDGLSQWIGSVWFTAEQLVSRKPTLIHSTYDTELDRALKRGGPVEYAKAVDRVLERETNLPQWERSLLEHAKNAMLFIFKS